MQQKKEYLTVKEVSKLKSNSPRNVRKIIAKLTTSTSKELLFKNRNDDWQIHHLLLDKFKRTRRTRCKYYAMTLVPSIDMIDKEIAEVMRYVYAVMESDDLEMHYSIEHKSSDGRAHLHCFTNCKQKRKLTEMLNLAFVNLDYHQSKIFDLAGWKRYIQKEGSPIITLSKNI